MKQPKKLLPRMHASPQKNASHKLTKVGFFPAGLHHKPGTDAVLRQLADNPTMKSSRHLPLRCLSTCASSPWPALHLQMLLGPINLTSDGYIYDTTSAKFFFEFYVC